jgi:hypothetical protein
MTPFLLLAALAVSAPSGDPVAICRSVRANALPDEQGSAYQTCVTEERAAMEKVKKAWPTASRDARANCAPIAGIPLSFVAVLTCMQMQRGGDLDPEKLKK